MYLSTNASLRVVETDFLASTNYSGNVFFNESFIPAIGEGFSLYWEPSTLLESSFLLAETVTNISGNHFLKRDLILPSLAKLIF